MSPRDRPPARNAAGWLSLVAVLGFVLMWWLFSGNGPQGPDGNDPVLLPPDVDASGDPGDGSPVPVALASGLRLTSYAVRGDAELDLEVSVPRGTCPELLTPRLVESEVSVTVTVTHSTEPDCRPTARDLTEQVSVRLDSPLDGRAVLDGALVQQTRVEPAG